MTDPAPGSNGWIVRELNRLSKSMEQIRTDQHTFQNKVVEQIATLQTKALIWGAIGTLVGGTMVATVVGVIMTKMLQ